MTCVWKGLLNCLTINDFKQYKIYKKPTEYTFVNFLKSRNQLCIDVTWNDEQLSEQFLTECFKSVAMLKTNSIQNGYWCSTCDPFLILVSQLFKINIRHKYCGIDIYYKCKNATRMIQVKSNKRHFQKA